MNIGNQSDWDHWLKRFEIYGNVPPKKVMSSQMILTVTGNAVGLGRDQLVGCEFMLLAVLRLLPWREMSDC